MNKRVLALFSGGLDSLIAVFLMKKLGFEVIPVFFETPFFPPTKALRVARANGLDLKVIDLTPAHLEMLVAPVYGYGKHFNPCIDCHGLMFRTLRDYIEIYGADFLISGEVLNQRPMSQRADAMNAVKKLSGIGDLIVRPLCQKYLPDTLPIREGWVSKDDLLDITGRSRTKQLELAEKWGLKEVQNSGGGCLLTDKGYTMRLKEIIDHNQLDLQNIKFLSVGRHFRINDTLKLIINRHTNEMDYMLKTIKDEIVLKCERVPGPIGVLISVAAISNRHPVAAISNRHPVAAISNHHPVAAISNRHPVAAISNRHPVSMMSPSSQDLNIAGSILLRYSPKASDTETISYGKQFALINHITCTRYDDKEIDKYRINKI